MPLISNVAHEQLPLVGRIKAASISAAGTSYSDIVDMSKFGGALVIFNMGDYAAGNDGTVSVVVSASNDGTSFTSSVAIPGKTFSASNFTGSTGDNAAGIMRVKKEDMVVSGTEYRYLRAGISPTNQDLICALDILGLDPRYGPGSDYDLAAVAEIIP